MNGTTHSSTDSLFPASLISPAVAAALPEAYTIRPLQRGDYAAGFLDVLRVLTTVGDVPQADFEARFDEMKQTGNGAVGTHVLVILDGEGKVVGTGALLVERKLYVFTPDL
jgi:glucosamine-phosphate N-acetyltransferase